MDLKSTNAVHLRKYIMSLIFYWENSSGLLGKCNEWSRKCYACYMLIYAAHAHIMIHIRIYHTMER